jgi:hypothetical protein
VEFDHWHGSACSLLAEARSAGTSSAVAKVAAAGDPFFAYTFGLTGKPPEESGGAGRPKSPKESAMKTKWFVVAWMFIFAVAVFDAGFAWVHRDSMASWELNPVMRHLAGAWGPSAAIALRLFTVAFAVVVVSRARTIWRIGATGFIGSMHIALLMVYVEAVL